MCAKNYGGAIISVAGDPLAVAAIDFYRLPASHKKVDSPNQNLNKSVKQLSESQHTLISYSNNILDIKY